MAESEGRSERRLFEAALQLDGRAREDYLAEVGAGGAELEQRLRALLAAHERPVLSPTTLERRAPQPAEQERVGPYRLLERVGEAEDLFLENLRVKGRVLGELHPSTVEGLQNLVILYEEMGDEERRAEYQGLFAETLRRVCDGPTARTEDRIDYANLLLTAEAAELRDPDRALALALRAVDETDRKDAEALAVLARAYEQTGNRGRAVATAEEAFALAAEGSEVRSQLEEILAGQASD
jgi:predicted Zn-dependent protease